VRDADGARPYRHLWVQVDGDTHGLSRFDVDTRTATAADTWAVPAHQRATEPVVVGDYVLSLVYDADAGASHVAVLRADELEAGPVCRAWFDHHIPITFHGIWVPS
jgi:all-trans-8'-apo-beta-carotenal 15,15'-oxygenase